jgi:hypothetical protein
MRINKDMPAYPGQSAEGKDHLMSRSRDMHLRGNEAIQRAGGEDPRRRDVAIVLERKIQDHDMSGYNHRDKPEMSLSDKEMRTPHEHEGPMMYADGIMR